MFHEWRRASASGWSVFCTNRRRLRYFVVVSCNGIASLIISETVMVSPTLVLYLPSPLRHQRLGIASFCISLGAPAPCTRTLNTSSMISLNSFSTSPLRCRIVVLVCIYSLTQTFQTPMKAVLLGTHSAAMYLGITLSSTMRCDKPSQ